MAIRRRNGPVPRPLEQRFWPKVAKSAGCWLWIAGGDAPTGYGRIREGGQGTPHLLAHRVAWELTSGPIPDGMCVCHHCDPVTGAVRWAVVHRDQACVLAKLSPTHVCRDRWGEVHASDDKRRLTIEHVKDHLMMGRRAPSDLRHLVALCAGSNIGVPSKAERAAIRGYLSGLGL